MHFYYLHPIRRSAGVGVAHFGIFPLHALNGSALGMAFNPMAIDQNLHLVVHLFG